MHHQPRHPGPMPRGMRMLQCILVFSLALVAPVRPARAADQFTTHHAPGQVVIGWRVGDAGIPQGDLTFAWAEDRTAATWQRAASRVAMLTGREVVKMEPGHGVALLAVPVGQEFAESERLRALPWVVYAEPNYVAWASDLPAEGAVYPTDPHIGRQWNMRRVDAPTAWAVTYGSYSFVVAFIDTGVDRSHPEFAYRLLPGYDYVNGDNDPNDDNGHGTHVAGIAAAEANNGVGVAGLAADVKLLPLKVLDYTGSGSYYNIATAIERAADAGAQVINLSLGGLSPSERLRAAVNYAADRGALVVAAAGNCAQGGPACDGRTNPDFYPAAYPGVLAVAASDHFDRWATYSGYKTYVDLAAPGGVEADPVWSTAPGGYGFSYGTSMAAPLASAAAALVWTMMPAATAQQIRDVLLSTADKVGTHPITGQPLTYVDGRNNYFGQGRLNAGRAVRWAYPPSLAPAAGPRRFLLGPPVAARSQVLLLANPSLQTVWWQASAVSGADWLSASPLSGSADFGRPAMLTLTAGPTARVAGLYAGAVRVQPLFPTGVPAFEVPVELQVVEAMHIMHLPLISQEQMAVRWYDPLAPDILDGRALYLADDEVEVVGLPFAVSFYGRTYASLRVSDNGLVLLGAAGGTSSPPPSGCLPSAAAPNNAIYVLASDLKPARGGQIYVHRADQRTFVVTWQQVWREGGASASSFQLVFRRQGPITANYLAVESPPTALIGAENEDGTVAQQIACQGSGRLVGAGDSVQFDPALPW